MDILEEDSLSPEELEIQNALAATGLVKQSVDDWLNAVDYKELNSGTTCQPSSLYTL